ncbi:sigma-70 family RNA polymerase sigma factor [uncultured Thermanaerothrix sp.]|uniref:sigma-70 family RNA polymerase sigma factor n=1 Tax=uncultured Thermanaerothrix sp. TaxID=1195149 RepID=UPI00262CEC4A|nr:sigma-70 family RNA polymerase sigma factor [uncultured Thermanaerothrix sp.]
MALAGMDDFSDLISRARALDAEALAALHDLLYPAVYRYIAYRLGDGPLSEDLTAEVFLRFLEALRARRIRGDNIRAWCFTTAHHLVMDHLRQQYRHTVQSLNGAHPDPQVHPEQALEAHQQLEAVQRAMRHLTPEQQHVLTLRFSQECSLEETAALMGKSINAVKVLQFRALMALRRWLEREGL